MLTFWDSSKNIGRIVGFILMEIIVINLAISWRAALILLVVLMVVTVLGIYYECEVKKEELRSEIKRDEPEVIELTWN